MSFKSIMTQEMNEEVNKEVFIVTHMHDTLKSTKTEDLLSRM